jgi:type 1 glutamine amidotransferase
MSRFAPPIRETVKRVQDGQIGEITSIEENFIRGPYGRFTVVIADADHPVTKGLTSFETTDELYTCLDGDRPIHVVAKARSKVDGKDDPMAFVNQYVKGRVFHCVLGHDTAALSVKGVQDLYRRGTAWTASLPPTGDSP